MIGENHSKEIKIICRELRSFFFKQDLNNEEQDIQEYVNNGYNIKSSNIIERANQNFMLYVILEKE